MKSHVQPVVLILLLLSVCTIARADYFADVGYTVLRAELGPSLPIASGVLVMIVEADKSTGTGAATYAPNAENHEFRGKKITVGERGPQVYAPFSDHATSVGRRFFGLRSSVSPGIDRIASYRTDRWFGSALLRLGETRQPKAASSRVASHAWVGGIDLTVAGPANTEALRRVDWLVETDEFFQVVGFNGGNKTPLLADAFNALSAANTGADRHRETLAIDTDYVAGRPRPHLLVPEKTPSAATGRVASVAALLIGIGHADPSLSREATVNRRGDRINNAERSEVIKAVLLAGADRVTRNSSGANVNGYRAAPSEQTTNGLDRRYGAGQLNVYNSYRILVAGEQDSTEDRPSGGQIGPAGFDHDDSFGGMGESNPRATYHFSTGSVGGQLTVSLVWNIDINGGLPLSFDATATFHDLDLALYRLSGDDRVVIAESRSSRDNSENIHVELAPKTDVAIHIQPGVGQPPFNWDYGLAWRFAETAVK